MVFVNKPTPAIYSQRQVVRCSDGELRQDQDLVVNEVPLTVFLNDNELATLICSPTGLQELAVGFLLSEGLVRDISEIKEIAYNEEDNLLWVQTNSPVPQMENFLRRQIASCCGKGRALLYFVNDASQLEPVKSTVRINPSHVLEMINALEEGSATFYRTGGVHSAALAASDGLVAHYEDIGRHNAVDKVMGHIFLKHVETSDKMLLLSGRVSSEILIKACRGGLPLVVSRSAPTMLALELADQFNLTVVGFARGHKFNIYSHPERIHG